jgi:hypothetical protein
VLPCEAGIYLTNGTFLYRVAGVRTSEGGDMAELEDCYGLDVVRVPVDDLRARGLRLVTPGTDLSTPPRVGAQTP